MTSKNKIHFTKCTDFVYLLCKPLVQEVFRIINAVNQPPQIKNITQLHMNINTRTHTNTRIVCMDATIWRRVYGDNKCVANIVVNMERVIWRAIQSRRTTIYVWQSTHILGGLWIMHCDECFDMVTLGAVLFSLWSTGLRGHQLLATIWCIRKVYLRIYAGIDYKPAYEIGRFV